MLYSNFHFQEKLNGGQNKKVFKNKHYNNKMFNSQKNVFWQALLFTIVIFAIGILLGFILENWRTSEIKNIYFQAELDLLDIKIQNEIYTLSNIDCNKAIEENINFANRIYKEAQLLNKYEEANKLSEEIISQHKKYDLLRTLFWLNTINIKKRCKADFHNIVYFYDYQEPSIETNAKQSVFSNLLGEIQKDKEDEIMLIPIAGDNGLTSVNLMMNLYNIKESELPIILIDEEIKITDIKKKEDIEKYL